MHEHIAIHTFSSILQASCIFCSLCFIRDIMVDAADNFKSDRGTDTESNLVNGKLGMWDNRAGPEVHAWAFGLLGARPAVNHLTKRRIRQAVPECYPPCVSCGRLARASAPLSRCLFNTIISHRSTCVRNDSRRIIGREDISNS